jgi:hypothetical protein
MKFFYLLSFFVTIALCDTIKIYLYTPTINTGNFKLLKMSFDTYLSHYGDYELQPFNDKETFENYLKDDNAIALLSSWHFNEIANNHHLQAQLVAQKNGSSTDKVVLVGQHNTALKGIVTSAYNGVYTQEMLNQIAHSAKFSVLRVPKEIDALMSVGFGMSTFALVSKESFSLLQTINPSLAQNLSIYNVSKPQYRMFLATNTTNKDTTNVIEIFKKMDQYQEGKRILNMIGMDKLMPYDPTSDDTKGIK